MDLFSSKAYIRHYIMQLSPSQPTELRGCKITEPIRISQKLYTFSVFFYIQANLITQFIIHGFTVEWITVFSIDQSINECKIESIIQPSSAHSPVRIPVHSPVCILVHSPLYIVQSTVQFIVLFLVQSIVQSIVQSRVQSPGFTPTRILVHSPLYIVQSTVQSIVQSIVQSTVQFIVQSRIHSRVQSPGFVPTQLLTHTSLLSIFRTSSRTSFVE